MCRGRFDELLDVDIGGGERRARFRLRLREIGLEFRGVAHNAHAAPAAAGGCFEDDGIADLLREPQRFFGGLHDSLRARQNRHAGALASPRERAASGPWCGSRRAWGR